MSTRMVLASAAAAVLFAAAAAPAQTEKKPAQPNKPGTIPAAPIQPAPPSKPDVKPEEPRTVPGQLKVGDNAPSLDVDDWVRGPKVEEFEDDKVYVVEFWATWCAPCVRSIPHLTELQREHKKDVVVIGVAASERAASKGGPDTRLQNLKNFVKAQGKQMDYRVAFDGDREMWGPWMAASGEGGIPHAFVVGHDGKIAWHGHPNDLQRGMKSALDALNASKPGSKNKKDKDRKDANSKDGTSPGTSPDSKKQPEKNPAPKK